jgi:O-antigen/teichoic acid export membrane protein
MLDLQELTTDGSQFIKKLKDYFLTIGESTIELTTALVVMVLVERFYDQHGLGVYAYLLSLLIIAGYISEFGIPRFAEHEIARTDQNPDDQIEILKSSRQTSLCLSLLLSSLFILTAGYDAAHTQIGERAVAYLIIGAILPLRSLNTLKLSILHGRGKHDVVAKLQTSRRLLFFGAIILLLIVRVPPSYLLLAFLCSEIFLAIFAVVKHKLPGSWKTWIGFSSVRSTLIQGYRYLFTDDALDTVLYIDFLILGFFVSSWELGVYAEASIIARFFLLIPLSIKPIFRRRYTLMTTQQEYRQAAVAFHRTTGSMFYIQCLLALFILLHFPEVLHAFYHTRGEELLSYSVFTVLVPGLIFFATVTSQEAVYEAHEQVSVLKKLAVGIAILNIFLNVYLVPFAGIFGAASATMISMLVYFLAFDIFLDKSHKIKKWTYLLAGAGVYLIYMLMQALNFGMAFDAVLAPIILFGLLFCIGFFEVDENVLHKSIGRQRLTEGGYRHGKHETGRANSV